MKQYGFTLIELLVVLAIATIITTTAIPSFRSFIQNNRMSTSVHKFVASLNLARSEAVKRGNRVTMCKSADQSTCAANGGWEQGWIVFVDDNENGQRETASEELIRVEPGLGGSASLAGQTAVEDYISYAGTGFAQPIGGGTLDTSQSTLVLCDSRNFGDHSRAIVISTTGSVRSTSATDASVNETIRTAASCSV
ncbi:MAG: GspH/FimT family pseudopilin [Gammaproteobacteria bacterium]|jgi:type IV fimbrial biogenesis protein FimT